MINDNRKPAVLVDIDGVLCDVSYKANPEDFDWAKFMTADLDRTPIQEGIKLVQMLVNQGLYPVFLTARPEYMRYQTEQMLAEYGFHGLLYMASVESSMKGLNIDYKYHQMIEKDRIIMKSELTKEFNFLYSIDDQRKNCKMFKAWGIPSLQVRFI